MTAYVVVGGKVQVRNAHTAIIGTLKPNEVGWMDECVLSGPLVRKGLLVAVETPPAPPEGPSVVEELPPPPPPPALRRKKSEEP